MSELLQDRVDELERGLFSSGGVPADVADVTRRWLESTSAALAESVGADRRRSVARARSVASVERAALRMRACNVVRPNHTGADLPRFHDRPASRAEHAVRYMWLNHDRAPYLARPHHAAMRIGASPCESRSARSAV